MRHRLAIYPVMATYRATVQWDRGAATFVDNRYSRRHTWTFDGGVTVPASSSPHVVPVPLSDPAAVDPEEAFVAALSSCHMLWFLSLAAQRGLVVERYVDDAIGVMGANAEGRQAMLRVVLRPAVRFADGSGVAAATIAALHDEAHVACFIANSVRSEVLCEPVVS